MTLRSFALALLVWPLGAQLAPRELPPRAVLSAEASFVVMGGIVTDGGRVDFGRLQLGDGGSTAAGPRRPAGNGRHLTPGGVTVRVLDVGAKLEFPSGGELLIDPRGRVHLRDGGATLPYPNGLRLVLADGARVDLLPQQGADRAFREVAVEDRGERTVLWRSGRVRNRDRQRDGFGGQVLHALGDGTALFEVADVGPMLIFSRVLCSQELQAALPERRAVVVGDLLARSLIEVMSAAEHHAAGDLRMQRTIAGLAALGPRVFAPGRVHARPVSAVGEPVVPLGNGLRLALSVPEGGGPTVLALVGPGDAVPLCEWTTTNLTRLHLIDRDAGAQGQPRYLMRGHALRHLTGRMLDFDVSPPARARARRVLAELAEPTLLLPTRPVEASGRGVRD